MSLIALKGWNFQTQTFETPEEFFHPFKNYNTGLRDHASLGQIITALNKIFPRDLQVELLRKAFEFGEGTDSLLYRLWSRVIMNEEIPILRLLSLQMYTLENDDEDDEGNYISHQSLRVEFDAPYCYAGHLDYYTTSNNIVIEDVHEDEIYDQIITHLKSNPNIGSDYIFNFTDNPEIMDWTVNVSSIYVRPSYAYAIWFHHFNRTTYHRVERFTGGGQRDDENRHRYTSVDVQTQWHSTHSIEVARFHALYDPPIFTWVIPIDGTNRSVFYRVHNYSTNVAQYIPGPLRHEGRHTSNLYGVELEVATSVAPQAIIDATDNLYCLCKHDTTVTGSKANKMEIVSGPADMPTHKKAWEAILSKVGYDNFDVTRETQNGMHVHVDLNAFRNKDGIPDSLHEKHFVWFFINPVNRPFHELVSEREEASLKTYAAAPALPKASLSRLFANTMSYILPPFRGIVCLKRDRNTAGYVTIEVRAFKGIVSLANIFKNLEFVDSVFNFTTKTNFYANTLDNYLQYLAATPKNKYGMLKEFLSRSDINMIRETSQLHSILWGADDPYAVINLIDKHHFPIRHDHLSYLNKLIPGAKFALPQPGLLKVTQTNRACLYDLDAGLHARFAKTRRPTENVSDPRS